jgi:hypothetical protein
MACKEQWLAGKLDARKQSHRYPWKTMRALRSGAGRTYLILVVKTPAAALTLIF